MDDNRRLAKEFAARELAEEQSKSKRLLANSFPGWGQGLKTKVTMKMNEETTTHLPHEEGTPQPAPAPAAEQQGTAIMMTSTEGPLLFASIPPGTPLRPGTISQFPQEFNESKSESDGSDGSGLDLDYGATSSDEEKPAELPTLEEALPLNSQPEHSEPNIQPVQAKQNI
jgi:hypothetical protein